MVTMSLTAVATTTYVQHPFIFAQLPSELIRQIFEHAAALDTRTALSLSLVASWVHNLAQPYLYHTVILSTARAVTSFTAALTSKPASFAPTHVKHLGILALGPMDAWSGREAGSNPLLVNVVDNGKRESRLCLAELW